jgi:hypothetical protein
MRLREVAVFLTVGAGLLGTVANGVQGQFFDAAAFALVTSVLCISILIIGELVVPVSKYQRGGDRP